MAGQEAMERSFVVALRTKYAEGRCIGASFSVCRVVVQG